MKPYSYSGKRHSNMDIIWKWAQSRQRAEPGRRTSRGSGSTARQRHGCSNSGGRREAKRAIASELCDKL